MPLPLTPNDTCVILACMRRMETGAPTRFLRLRQWRIDEGLTIDEVADLTGYSVAMLSRAERGLRTFSPKARVTIARRLGVRVSELFEVEPLEELEEVPT